MTRFAAAAAAAGCPRDQVEGFIRNGIILQPQQLKACAAARECDHEGGPVAVAFGGARSGGKSHWGLAQLTDDCLRFPGLTCLLLRKVGKANKENFEELRLKVLRSVPTTYRRQEGTLLFANGSKIILGHFQNENDVDAYLGLEYDVILVEEATTLSSSKYKMIATCNRSSKPGWRPRMYSTTNPGGVGHSWYLARFITPYRNRKEVDTRFIPATVDDNKCVNPEYKKTLDGLTGWQYKAWRLGDWDIAAGQFFTTFRRDVHVVSSWPFGTVPKHWRFWASLDYGFIHYTAVYLFAQDGDGHTYVIDEHSERRWLPARHCEAIHAMLHRHGLTVERLDSFVAGRDVRAPSKNDDSTTTADTYAQHGIVLTNADDDRVNGCSELLTLFGDPDAPRPSPPRIQIFDRCTRLIDCIPSLEHDPHKPEAYLKVDTDDDGVGGDDWGDSLRYGAMEARKYVQGRILTGGTRLMGAAAGMARRMAS